MRYEWLRAVYNSLGGNLLRPDLLALSRRVDELEITVEPHRQPP